MLDNTHTYRIKKYTELWVEGWRFSEEGYFRKPLIYVSFNPSMCDLFGVEFNSSSAIFNTNTVEVQGWGFAEGMLVDLTAAALKCWPNLKKLIEQKTPLKFKIKDEKQSAELQALILSMDVCWGSGASIITHTSEPYLIFNNLASTKWVLVYANEEDDFKYCNYSEYDLENDCIKEKKKRWRVKTLIELLNSGWSLKDNGDLILDTTGYHFVLYPYEGVPMQYYCGKEIPYDDSESFKFNNWFWTKEMLVEVEE